MAFQDFHFKLSVISALHDLGYYVAEVEEIKAANKDWDQNYQPIPAVLDYYRNLVIDPEYLAEIDAIQPDGGDLCYFYIFNVWDGEDNQFDITSIEGIEQLANLELFDPFSMIAEEGLDYTPLLACHKLQKVAAAYIKQDVHSENILRQLQNRGVEIA